MHYVYVLKSKKYEKQFYYGCTKDLRGRLAAHNSGQSSHTSKYKPWDVVWYGAFQSADMAKSFENYLKTAS